MTDNFLMTFVTSKYLTDNDKANVANSSKIGKTEIMNHTAWKDRHANAVDKLLKFLESHYDLNGSGGTYSIMHIKTWSNPLLDTSKDTLDIILNNSTLNKEVQLQLLTGGRNLELKYFLEGLNLSFTNLLIKITTTGIGIGWTNVVTLQASFHNSFILISLVFVFRTS